MPILAGLILKLFTAVLAFFSAYMTKQIAMRVAWMALFVTLTTAFFVAVKAIIASIYVAVPSEVMEIASWVLPSNTSTCFAAYWSARALRWAYDCKITFSQIRLF